MNNIVVSSITQANQSNLYCLMVRGDAYARRLSLNKLRVLYAEVILHLATQMIETTYAANLTWLKHDY